MKEIVIIVPVFDESEGFGGVVTAMKSYAESLSLYSHVTVLTTSCIRRDGHLYTKKLDDKRLNNITIKYYGSINIFGGPMFANGILRYLRDQRNNIDAVYISSIWQIIGPLSAKICRNNGIKYIVAPHGSLAVRLRSKNLCLKTIYFNFFWKRLLADSSFIHVTCRNEIEDSDGWISASKSRIVPNIINKPVSKLNAHVPETMWRNSDEEIILLNVGRSDWKKRNDEVIKLLRYDERLRFIFVGDDNTEVARNWLLYAEELGLRSRVTFTGMIPHEEIHSYYRNADIFILFSENENFGLVVGEALLNGSSCIISQEVGISEFLSDLESVSVIDRKLPLSKSEFLKILHKHLHLTGEQLDGDIRKAQERFDIRKVGYCLINEIDRC